MSLDRATKGFTAHLIIVLGVVSIAVAMRVYGLNSPVAHSPNEGVYWQTLRAMHAGFRLYDQIFYSQPPMFIVSVDPFYELLGQSIASARAGIAALSLLGLLGAYMIGSALGGRVVALVSMIVLVFTPLYLEQSQILQAEAASTAFLLLSVGAALLWWRSPEGKAAVFLAILCGTTLSIGIMIKLLGVAAAVPVLMLVLWRVWTSPQDGRKGWRLPTSILPGLLAGLACALFVLIPFLSSLGTLMDQVVTYHLVARRIVRTANFEILGRFFITNAFICLAAIVAAILAFIRRDWRVVPLVTWALTTSALLVIHSPLFEHHVVVLIPPLIAITALGLSILAPMGRHTLHALMSSAQLMGLLTRLLVFAAVIAGIVGCYGYLSASTGRGGALGRPSVVADLGRVTEPDQWIITDAPFIAGLADRDMPPWLVDTSQIRIYSGYLATKELLEAASDPRVHAVVFALNRFALGPTANFHSWVALNFALVRSYGPGRELWIR